MNKNTRVMLLHNVVSPYREPLFNSLSSQYELTVVYCSQMLASSERLWEVKELKGYQKYFLKGFRFSVFVINLQLLPYLMKNKYDCFIVTDNNENLFSVLLVTIFSKISKKPLVVWSGHIESIPLKNVSFTTRILRSAFYRLLAVSRRFIYNYADSFVAYSQWSKDYLTNRGVEAEKIFFGTQVMPANLLPGPSKKLSLSKRVNVLYLGYFRASKGLEYLIKTFEQQHANNLSLYLVGGGPEEANLLKLANSNKNIHFQPYAKPQMRANWYSSCDILIFPTLGDSWGHVITEALFYGIPVITTEAAGASQIIRNYCNGIVISPGDEEDLRKVLYKIDSDNGIITKMKQYIKNNLDRRYYDISYATETFIKAIDFALPLTVRSK